MYLQLRWSRGGRRGEPRSRRRRAYRLRRATRPRTRRWRRSRRRSVRRRSWRAGAPRPWRRLGRAGKPGTGNPLYPLPPTWPRPVRLLRRRQQRCGARAAGLAAARRREAREEEGGRVVSSFRPRRRPDSIRNTRFVFLSTPLKKPNPSLRRPDQPPARRPRHWS